VEKPFLTFLTNIQHLTSNLGSASQLAVQVERRADEAEVRKRLRKISQRFAGGADLFSVQADVIGVRQHFLENQPRLVHAARSRQHFHHPEGADAEGALPTW